MLCYNEMNNINRKWKQKMKLLAACGTWLLPKIASLTNRAFVLGKFRQFGIGCITIKSSSKRVSSFKKQLGVKLYYVLCSYLLHQANKQAGKQQEADTNNNNEANLIHVLSDWLLNWLLQETVCFDWFLWMHKYLYFSPLRYYWN